MAKHGDYVPCQHSIGMHGSCVALAEFPSSRCAVHRKFPALNSLAPGQRRPSYAIDDEDDEDETVYANASALSADDIRYLDWACS